MSLKVWLPLNGNTNNYGTLHQLDSIKVCKEPKYNTDIGGGIEFTGNTNNLLLFPEKELYLAYTDNFTISGWFYNTNLNTEGSSRDYSFTIGRVDVGEGGIGARFSNKQFLVYYNKIVFAIPTEYEEWNNFTFTKHGTTGYYYKNGVLIGTKVLNSDPAWSAGNQGYCGLGLGCFYYGSYTAIYPWKGKIKDFRIYDEVLSEQQIKDLSRGLFVHYKLNQPERSENICLKNTLDEITATNEFLRILSNGDYKDLGVGDYTFSCYMKVAKGEPMPNIYYTDGRYDSKYKYSIPEIYTDDIKSGKLSTEYKKVIARLQFENNIENCNIMPNVSIYYTYGSGQIPSIKYVKLEKGWNPNPQWTPSSKDSITWDNTEYDGSGFCNHGQLIGSVTTDFTTPRYDLAYSFNNSGYIKNDNFNCTVDKCTISFWIKPKSTLSSEYQFTLGTFSEWTENGNGNGIGIWTDRGKESTPYIRHQFQVNGTSQALQINFTWYVDTWQMITFVSDCKKCYIYRNAELIKSYDMIYDSIINPTLYLGNGRFGNINKQNSDNSMSDFRFYTSALSADDIKEIYNYRK